MKRISVFSVVMTLCVAILLGGCGAKPALTLGPDKQSTAYEVKDSQENVVKLAQKPQRIVSLTLGTDEILLGLVPVERITALTYLADDPGISNIAEQAKQIPKKVKANPEEIIALQPDLLIIADWQPVELIQTIRGAGIPVYVYKTPNTIIGIKKVIGEIAQVVGEEETGKEMVAQMDQQLSLVSTALSKVNPEQQKTVVRFSLMGGSGGAGSLFDDVCQYAKVVNGAAKVGIGMNELMSKEQVVQANPQVFILPTWDYTGKTDLNQFKADMLHDPAFQTIPAIKEKQLFMLPDRYLASPSQYIVQGVRDVAKAAYPQYIN
jgi:iron complex transport system substrate-binding protein